MDKFTVFPTMTIKDPKPVSARFLELGIDDFIAACRFVHELPYGYNSDRDDLLILLTEKFGSCTTKHAVIATLAEELGLPIHKMVGIYAMTEDIVSGTNRITEKYALPYIPMVHCYLAYQNFSVDLTEGNANGKKRSIDTFLYTQGVIPNISAKDEYLLYRKALTDRLLKKKEFDGIDAKRVLHAREEGIALLKANIA